MDVAAVYREHFEFVFVNLRRLGVPDASLEDACHEVFLVVHRRAAHCRIDAASIRPWLYGVARRVAADVRRGRARHRRRVLALQTLPEDHDATTDEIVADRRLVQDFLDVLDPEKRDVFILVELEDMSAREVGEVLGINPNTAAARLRAARKRFAEHLDVLAAGDHAERIVEAARSREPAAAPTRARVWAALGPLVTRALPAATNTSTLLVAGLAGLLTTTTVAIVMQPRAPTVDAATGVPLVARDDGDAASWIEPASLPAAIADIPVPTPGTPTADARPHAPRAVAEPSATTPRADADDLPLQTELAGRVLQATAPTEILALVDEYRSRFGDGFFADRLSARRIEALCDTGQHGAASREHAVLSDRQPALAERAFARCSAADDHESDARRPSAG